MCEHDVGIALSIHPHAREHDGSSCDLQRGGGTDATTLLQRLGCSCCRPRCRTPKTEHARTSESAPTSMVQAVPVGSCTQLLHVVLLFTWSYNKNIC